jgi:hypothetical protein
MKNCATRGIATLDENIAENLLIIAQHEPEPAFPYLRVRRTTLITTLHAAKRPRVPSPKTGGSQPLGLFTEIAAAQALLASYGSVSRSLARPHGGAELVNESCTQPRRLGLARCILKAADGRLRSQRSAALSRRSPR